MLEPSIVVHVSAYIMSKVLSGSLHGDVYSLLVDEIDISVSFLDPPVSLLNIPVLGSESGTSEWEGILFLSISFLNFIFT